LAGKETAQVRVSVDNGKKWSTVWSRTDDDRSSNVTLDLSADAAGQEQVIIEFRYTATWGYWWQVDNVLVQAGECALVPGGVVSGYVYDANTTTPLVGASVASLDIITQSFELPYDPVNTGLYWAFQPTDIDPEDVVFTASMSEYDSDSSTVAVFQDAVNRQDFYLGTGYLVIDPTAYIEYLNAGDDPINRTLTLTNAGSKPVDYSLNILNRGFSPTSIPAYAIDVIADNLVYNADITAPEIWETIGSLAGYGFVGGDFLGGDFSTLYAVDSYTNKLFSINTSTASIDEIGLTTVPTGEEWTGLSGATDGTLYGVSTKCGASTNLLTIDPSNAETTNLGSLPDILCGIDLAYNADDGMIYIVDSQTNSLFRVNPGTLETTDVGSLGVLVGNYFQGLDYEEESGELYWAVYYQAIDSSELRVIDTEDGISQPIGPFPGGGNVPVLAFATGGPVKWLSLAPDSGIIDPGSAVEVNILFDPSLLVQSGTYSAELKIHHDTIYNYGNIPVSLYFNPPPPIITSDASTTFIIGQQNNFTIQATGVPAPDIEIVGELPEGVSFKDNGDGSAILSGIPGASSFEEYPLTITASNGVGPDDTQEFTLTIDDESMVFLPLIIR